MNATRGWGLLERTLSRWRFSTVLGLLKEAGPAGRILDLGCGPHAHFLPLTKFGGKFGIDLYLRFGSGFGSNGIHLLCCDLQTADPPFRPGSFDAIIAMAFFEHLHMDRGMELLRSVHALLKPGGILILTTPAPWMRTALNLMALVRLVSPAEIADHKAYYSRESIAQALAAAGFPIAGIRIGMFMAGANCWAVAQKK